MSYRIERYEAVQDAVRRIAREQVDRALDELEEELHDAVHQARKRCKKVRPVLRLVRPAFEDTYQRENTWYRDTGRILSDVRDATAVVETFDEELAGPYADRLDDRLLKGARTALVDRRERLVEAHEVERRVADVRGRLREGAGRTACWDLGAEGWEAIGPGVAKSYGRGLRRLEEARERPDTEVLHQWRKRAKYHRHHVRLIAQMWPDAMEARRRVAQELTDVLGADHDLAVLRDLLRDEQELLGSPGDREVLVGVLDARRERLRDAAMPLGRRLFAEPADGLADRLGTYWEVWRDGARLTP